MGFEKRHIAGIAITLLVSFIVVELLRGNIGESFSFDTTRLMRLISDFGIVVTVTFLVVQLYIHLLWRFDPLCRIPVLKKEYIGTVAYVYKGKAFSNEVKIKVKQSMDKVELDMTTPLMRSRTLNGCFVEDRGMPVLYYVFNIEPRTLNPNPSERRMGAARLLPNENNDLEGYYWTDQGNQGRLFFYITGELPVSNLGNSSKTQSLSSASVNSSAKSGIKCGDNTNIVTVTVGNGNNVGVSSVSTKNLLSCLAEISNQKNSSFSGLGIIICDESFDQINLVSLRPDLKLQKNVNIYSSEGREFLLNIANTDSNSHDGFFVIDGEGNLVKVAQYLFPPLSSKKPDVLRGTRSYSALCGSMLKGVVAIGIVSKDGTIAIYQNGECIFDSRKADDQI